MDSRNRPQGHANPLLLLVLAAVVIVGGVLVLEGLGDPRHPDDGNGKAGPASQQDPSSPGAVDPKASPPARDDGAGDPTKVDGGSEVSKAGSGRKDSPEREAWNQHEMKLMEVSHDPAVAPSRKRQILEELQASKYGKVHVPGEVKRMIDEVPSEELLRELFGFMGKHPNDAFPIMLTEAYARSNDKDTRLEFFKALGSYPGNSYLLSVLDKFERTVNDPEIHEAIVRARNQMER